MKTDPHSRSRHLTSLIAGAALCASSISASESSYKTVVDRLDVGGEFIGFMDIAQDPESLVETLQSIYLAAQQADPSVPAIPVDFKTVVGRFGIFGLDAMGASSIREDDGLFLNKAYLYFPEGRSGLFAVLGGEAHELALPEFAPADAVVAIEADLDLQSIRSVVKAVAADIMGPMGVSMIDQQLAQPLGPIAWTWNDLLDRGNTRLKLCVSIDESLPGFPVEGKNVTIPAMDFVVCLDGLGEALDLLTPMALGSEQATLEESDAFDYLQMVEERPPEMQHLRPVLARIKSTNQLVVASRLEYLNVCLGDGPKLKSNAAFVHLTRGFPTKGNAMSFVAKEFVDQFSNMAMANAEQEDPKAAVFLKAVHDSSLFRFNGGASVSVNESTGVMMYSREDSSYKSKILAAPVALAAVTAAVAVPAIGEMRKVKEMQETPAAEEHASTAE